MGFHTRRLVLGGLYGCVLWLAALSTAATTGEVPVATAAFPQGTFEHADAAGRPLGWPFPDDQRFQRVDAGGGNHFLRISSDNPDARTRTMATFALTERDWARLKVTARMRAPEVRPGTIIDWKQPRLDIRFLDAQRLELPDVGFGTGIGQSDSWRQIETEGAIPPGAVFLQFQLGLVVCAGTMEVDDIRLEPTTAGQPADAKLPEGERTYWGEEPVETVSRTRAEICINGLWRFMPATDIADAAPTEQGWGYIRVPGDWSRDWMPGIVAKGQGRVWAMFHPQDASRAWYERPIRIPAGWRARQVILDLQRVSTDAEVYLDGQSVGRVVWPGGEIDLTPAVRFGQDQTLRLLVVAARKEDTVLRLMESAQAQVSIQKAELSSRGIIGDVLLRARPKGPRVSDVFVKPSVRRKQLDVALELTGVKSAGQVEVVARALDESGAVARTFSSTATVRAADEAQTLELSWPWPDPRLWDLQQPNLYTLHVSVRGAGVDDEYAQRFGFREFWIEGRDFYLNGSRIRLRPCQFEEPNSAEGIDAAIDGVLAGGFNFIELWPSDHGQRGYWHTRTLFADRADRKGMLISGVAMHMGGAVMGDNYVVVTDDMSRRESWRRRMTAELRQYRNHPSIIMWGHSGNLFGGDRYMDPRTLGVTTHEKEFNENWHKLARAGREMTADIKALDPTRPVFSHMGGAVGDVFTINHYLNFIPLQEREEWMSHWARHGKMPYMAVEFGTPLHTSFMRGRAYFEPAVHSEPLATEYAAIYLGAETYRLERPEYRRAIREKFKGEQAYANWHNDGRIDFSPPVQGIEGLFIKNTWRSWRTMGLSGGMIPWSWGHGWQGAPAGVRDKTAREITFEPGRRGPYVSRLRVGEAGYLQPPGWIVHPAGQALMENNGPTLAWIAGPAPTEQDPAAFNAKDHSFAPGQRVTKTAALLNDTRLDASVTTRWTASLSDGTAVESGSASLTLPPGRTQFVPIEFAIPVEATDATGRIELTAKIGDREHRDVFAFRVLSPSRADGVQGVLLHDPEGDTAAMLEALGVKWARWDGRPSDRLLVIGRRGWSGGALPGDLEQYVASGGRVLLMAQDPAWMASHLGLRIMPAPTRWVFPVDARHPILEGLTIADLRDWAGTSTLVPPTIDPASRYRKGTHGFPWNGWRWGNRGAVSSAAMEKPHRSGWRPLLECEFDLAWTPLMELDYGRGRITACTLDFEDHVSTDPAAARLAAQLLRHAATAPLAPREQVAYIGGDEGRATLDALGVQYEPAEVMPGSGLVVIGPGATVEDAALRDFVTRGGRAVVLAHAGERLPLGVSAARDEAFAGATDVPDWPEARGLSASELRNRTDGPAWVLDGGCEVGAGGQLGRLRIGRGSVVFAQIDPAALDADRQTFNRLTRWRQTRALAQVLANTGAAFAADRRVLAPRGGSNRRVSLAGTWQARMTLQRDPSPGPDRAHADPGISEAARSLVAAEVSAETGLRPVDLPVMFGELGVFDGEVVFRRTFEAPAALVGEELELTLGRVDDFDEVFVNGTSVGRTDDSTAKHWEHFRRYRVPAGVVRAGRNVIAVRVWDRFGGGGFGGNAEDLAIQLPGADAVDPAGLYHPDYRSDWELGDDPYRVFRW
jgi:beta-galactosidase